jgi:hypothetical protein
MLTNSDGLILTGSQELRRAGVSRAGTRQALPLRQAIFIRPRTV